MADASTYTYDACLSFAGEDRQYVQQVAEFLRAAGVSFFFDEYEQVELWGKDLYTHLDYIYRIASRFCVIFISQHYAKKLWTNHERKSAQARAFEVNSEYLLPARFDETEIPGLTPTIGYIDLRTHSPKQLATLIEAKVRQRTSQTGPAKDAASISPTDTAIRLVGERRDYWAHKDTNLWLVTLLAPAEPLRRDFDPLCDGTIEALHGLNLPGYIAGRITTRPNSHLTRSRPGRRLVHEEFRKLSEGFGFRVEVWPEGLIEIVFCLTELLRYFPAAEIDRLQYGSAPVDAARALLPYPSFAAIAFDHLRLMLTFWEKSEAPFSASTLAVDLFGASGLSLLIPGRLEALVGFPLEEGTLLHEYPLRAFPESDQLAGLILRDFVNDFGLSLKGFKDQRGELLMPALFAHG